MEHALIGEEYLFMGFNGKKGCTVAEIEKLPEGQWAELINGEMYMLAAPALVHQDILGWIYMKIRSYIAEGKGKCKVLPAPFAVYELDDEYNYVEPDISVICDEGGLDEKGCHGAPDWVIEIVPPSSKYMDYVRKLTLYQLAGDGNTGSWILYRRV